MMVELWTRKREMADEDDNEKEDVKSYEKSGVWHALLSLEDLVLVRLPAGSGLIPAISGMVNWLHTIFSKSQFLMMISPFSCDLSLSCAQLYHHLRTRS